ELMAQYGWTNLKQAEIYTKKADRAWSGIRTSTDAATLLPLDGISDAARQYSSTERQKASMALN
ncbi:hypothetical protein VVZ00_14885, partial [Brucella melitensis]|uniref:hypothetical protein n=1 Tax=Brucella melitensis TaxID=29459 RepID=UPI002F3A7D24